MYRVREPLDGLPCTKKQACPWPAILLKHPISFFTQSLNRPTACDGADHSAAENNRIPNPWDDLLVDECSDYHADRDDDREPGRTQDHVKNKSDPKAKNGE